MRKYLILLALPVLFGGCNNNQILVRHTCEQDSIRYANMIMNLVINNYKYLVPDYGYEGQLLHNDTSYYIYKSTKVLNRAIKRDTMNGFTGSHEIKDAKLGLDLRIHRWTCGCEVSIPNTIIYISNQKDFDYAFVFHDENLVKKDDDTLHKGTLPEGPPTLEFQLNYLANRLKLNFLTKKKDAEHFVSLIADSLLCLKRVTSQDTSKLRSEENEYKDIPQMIKDIANTDSPVLYYRSSTRYFKGYWRFEIALQNNDRLYIRVLFNKSSEKI